MTSAFHPSPLKALAAKWQVFATFAVMFARMLRRFEDNRIHGARRQAAEFEFFLRAAHIMLQADIANAQDTHPPETEDDQRQLQHLQFIACALLCILLVVTRVQHWLCGDFGWRNITEQHAVHENAFFIGPDFPIAILDSS